MRYAFGQGLLLLVKTAKWHGVPSRRCCRMAGCSSVLTTQPPLLQYERILLPVLPNEEVRVLARSGAVAYEPCGLGTIAYAKDLVGGTQVLLYGRLGEKEAPGYLGVGQTVADQL